MTFYTQGAQMSQDGQGEGHIQIYAIIKTMCSPSYNHYRLLVTHL